MDKNHLLAHIGQYALITNAENKLLILERTRSKTWCLPGGRLDKDEEWSDALLRELKEELNLKCSDPKPIDVNVLIDPYQTKYCVYFSVRCPDIASLHLSAEHSNFGWFSIDEIKNLNIEDDQIKKVIIDYLSEKTICTK